MQIPLAGGPRQRRLAALVLLMAGSMLLAMLAALPGTARAGVPGDQVRAHAKKDAPQRIILDTDIGRWWDDIIALSMANVAQSHGDLKLLGVMVDVWNRWDAPAADAVNTFYQHGNIPIGVVKDTGERDYPQNYSQYVAENFHHSLKDGAKAPDAVELYRKLLSKEDDHAVTIVAVGGLTNLADLLASGPDQFSPLSGRDLVAQKVKRMVVMGGYYPSSPRPETNFAIDPAASQAVVNGGWPTPMVFDGFEIGRQVRVGGDVCDLHPADSPVRGIYDLLFGCGNPPGDGSWDPTAMYYALHGLADVYEFGGEGGANQVSDDGNNAWQDGTGGTDAYLVVTSADSLGHQIEAYLNEVPAKKK